MDVIFESFHVLVSGVLGLFSGAHAPDATTMELDFMASAWWLLFGIGVGVWFVLVCTTSPPESSLLSRHSGCRRPPPSPLVMLARSASALVVVDGGVGLWVVDLIGVFVPPDLELRLCCNGDEGADGGVSGFCWVSTFSPELVPVVYSPFTGVGSSFVVLTVCLSAGVCSCWFISLLFVSTGLLCGFPQGCHVIIIVECPRRSVDFGSFSIPKGVVELGLSLMPRGVTCVGPSGIIFLLTVLVSGLSSGGFIPCSTLRLDVLIVILYVTFVSVLVSLTLNTYHMLYCGVV